MTAKVILNVAPRGWMAKNIFHSRSPKTPLNRIIESFCFAELPDFTVLPDLRVPENFY